MPGQVRPEGERTAAAGRRDAYFGADPSGGLTVNSADFAQQEAPRREPNPTTHAPSDKRAEIDAGSGAVLLEFGSPTCGYCRTAQPLIEQMLREQKSGAQAAVRHLKIADGPGKPLGRSFGVKLWPTLVFLRDGKELARSVRPRELAPMLGALRTITVGV
jgi:thioredoxin 1